MPSWTEILLEMMERADKPKPGDRVRIPFDGFSNPPAPTPDAETGVVVRSADERGCWIVRIGEEQRVLHRRQFSIVYDGS